MSFFQLLAYVPLYRVSYKQKVLHVRKSKIRVLLMLFMLYVKVERIFTRDVTCNVQFLKNEWVRYIATGEGGGQGGHALPLQFPSQTRFNSFSFKHQRYCFLWVSEIIWTRNLTIFTVSATIFGQFRGLFIFSNYIGEINHFTVGFLKRSNT